MAIKTFRSMQTWRAATPRAAVISFPSSDPPSPNRLFLHSAQTDRLNDSINLTSLPTIWDRLAAAGVSGHYYFNNIPFVALWGTKYLGITKSYNDFKSAA